MHAARNCPFPPRFSTPRASTVATGIPVAAARTWTESPPSSWLPASFPSRAHTLTSAHSLSVVALKRRRARSSQKNSGEQMHRRHAPKSLLGHPARASGRVYYSDNCTLKRMMLSLPALPRATVHATATVLNAGTQTTSVLIPLEHTNSSGAKILVSCFILAAQGDSAWRCRAARTSGVIAEERWARSATRTWRTRFRG